MNIWMDRAVGGRKDRPRRACPPGWGGRFLAERNSGERALGDRHERGLRVWQIGAERLVKPAGVDGELGAAIRHRGGPDVPAGACAGKFDCSAPRSSPSSGANPATYTSPPNMGATPAPAMTPPPFLVPPSTTRT